MMLTFPSFLRRAFFVGPGSFWLKVDLVVVSVSLVRGRRDPPTIPPAPRLLRTALVAVRWRQPG
jgi:hypothetical protein